MIAESEIQKCKAGIYDDILCIHSFTLRMLKYFASYIQNRVFCLQHSPGVEPEYWIVALFSNGRMKIKKECFHAI